jgi:hypothetical protein
LFWRPKVALFVNAPARLPVFVALAPAASLVERFAYGIADLRALSFRLARTPCGPLRGGDGIPDRALREMVDRAIAPQPPLRPGGRARGERVLHRWQTDPHSG